MTAGRVVQQPLDSPCATELKSISVCLASPEYLVGSPIKSCLSSPIFPAVSLHGGCGQLAGNNSADHSGPIKTGGEIRHMPSRDRQGPLAHNAQHHILARHAFRPRPGAPARRHWAGTGTLSKSLTKPQHQTDCCVVTFQGNLKQLARRHDAGRLSAPASGDATP